MSDLAIGLLAVGKNPIDKMPRERSDASILALVDEPSLEYFERVVANQICFKKSLEGLDPPFPTDGSQRAAIVS